MELNELIAHEYGLWAAAGYFRSWLADFAGRAPAEAGAEIRGVQAGFQALPGNGGAVADAAPMVRGLVDQACFLAQLYDPDACRIETFRAWLESRDDLAFQIDYVLAAMDHVLDEFVWSVTIEMQEMRSLRKALLVNLMMWRELGRQAETGSPEDESYQASVEMNLRDMLARSRRLLRTYAE